ncbi:hypothetical protein UCREL1_4248 [Eutypa lata UCREL1]|uniref:Uncharacterized protein n=1 Tax=Eutypa lata (strain UCR-EL1) TaxID=1287681 RepID=M7TFL0_EUTLA|nr:hypothetical protein UCREL1_4248 [Eutypa lata UCREL1]
MSKIVGDVKSGIKAVRGAGDTIRGTAMEVTDQALDSNSNHPDTVASQAKNRSITEKGKQDMKIADEEVGLREREKANRGVAGSANTIPGHRPAATANAPTPAPTPASAPYADGMTRPNDPKLR